jgi:hypothetical protein
VRARSSEACSWFGVLPTAASTLTVELAWNVFGWLLLQR